MGFANISRYTVLLHCSDNETIEIRGRFEARIIV